MAYKQKSEDLNNVARSMRDRGTYTKGGGDKKKDEVMSDEEAAKINKKREKLEARAAEKGWSTKKQVRKGAAADPTKELPQGWKGVWKKGEYVGAREKVSIGGLPEGGGKIPTTPRTPPTKTDDGERKQKIDTSIKKRDFKPSGGPSKSKYLGKGGKHFGKKKVGRRAGANRNIRGFKKP